MKRTITATYRGGVFHPDEPCNLPEGATVEIRELANGVRPPLEADPEERRRIMSNLVKRMTENPLCLNAPRFTRDELHERR
jgi:predicted DNA-binding antitoxin AbrB/MazE fold protein